MRNEAQETLFQIALRKYSKEIEGKVSIYVIFGDMGVGDMQSSTPPDLSWLQCRSKQESQAPALELLARDTLETNPITVKPNPESHMVKQSSVPLPCCSPPRPLPNKVLLYQHMCLLGQLLSEC